MKIKGYPIILELKNSCLFETKYKILCAWSAVAEQGNVKIVLIPLTSSKELISWHYFQRKGKSKISLWQKRSTMSAFSQKILVECLITASDADDSGQG